MFFKTIIFSETFVLSVFLILYNTNIANGKLWNTRQPEDRVFHTYVSVTLFLPTHMLYRIMNGAGPTGLQGPLAVAGTKANIIQWSLWTGVIPVHIITS
jgi:hypothetical protein